MIATPCVIQEIALSLSTSRTLDSTSAICEATIKANLNPRLTNAIAVVIPMIRIRCSVLVVTQATHTWRLSDAIMKAKTTKLRVLLVTETAMSVGVEK